MDNQYVISIPYKLNDCDSDKILLSNKRRLEIEESYVVYTLTTWTVRTLSKSWKPLVQTLTQQKEALSKSKWLTPSSLTNPLIALFQATHHTFCQSIFQNFLPSSGISTGRLHPSSHCLACISTPLLLAPTSRSTSSTMPFTLKMEAARSPRM